MKKFLLIVFAAFVATTIAGAATIVPCTVNAQGNTTGVVGPNGSNTVANISTATQTTINMFSCAGIAAVGATNNLNNVVLFGTADYSNGNPNVTNNVLENFCTAGTCGAFGAVNLAVNMTGGFSSGASVPPSPFVISNLGNLGVNGSVAAFQGGVNSAVTAGGPVSNSTAQMWISYDVVPVNTTPEPTTSGLIGLGMLAIGFASRKIRK